MTQRKKLADMNLLDSFLFGEAMENCEFAELFLSIILDEEIKLMHPPQSEKEMRHTPQDMRILADSVAKDQCRAVYNSEAQKKNTGNLPRRNRYYHGRIDNSLLEPGTLDYNELPDSFLIMISPFDLFKRGRFQYTFRMRCDEEPNLPLDDGAVRIYLNTRGVHEEEVRPELVGMLRYCENSTAKVAEASGSPRVMRMHEIIESIKKNKDMEVKSMYAWEEKAYARLEGREEGHAEGLAEGLAMNLTKRNQEIALKMLQRKIPIDEISEITGLSIEEVNRLLQ